MSLNGKYFFLQVIKKIFVSIKSGVLKWWVAGPEFLTLNSMRVSKYRH